MSSSRDDERVLDALLADAREAPRPEDLARVEHRLQDWLAPAPAAAPPARASSRSVGSSRVLKPLVIAAIGAGLMTQVFLDGRATNGGGTPPEAASLATPGDLLPPPPAAPPNASVAVADLPDVPETAPEPPARPAADPTPSTAARPRPAPAPAAETSSVLNEPLAGDAIAESEASFLRRTRATVADDPARALRMTEEHASRYPQGVLTQEREVIAIDALVRLGKRDEARARASAFLTRYPRSAHAGRVAAILDTEAR